MESAISKTIENISAARESVRPETLLFLRGFSKANPQASIWTLDAIVNDNTRYYLGAGMELIQLLPHRKAISIAEEAKHFISFIAKEMENFLLSPVYFLDYENPEKGIEKSNQAKFFEAISARAEFVDDFINQVVFSKSKKTEYGIELIRIWAYYAEKADDFLEAECFCEEDEERVKEVLKEMCQWDA